MSLPLLLVGAAVGSLFAHDKQKDFLKAQDNSRRHNNSPTGRDPSEILPSPLSSPMVVGAVVCCEVYEAFLHTAVVIDVNTIVELHGSGLIRAVSKDRFLRERSGKNIFIACDLRGKPHTFSDIESLASADIYNFYEYDLLKSNCYRHTWKWLCGEDASIENFSDFNHKLSCKLNEKIYWDVVN